jgi:hypothetical protein
VGRSIVLLGRELMGVETATVVIFIFAVERIPHIHHYYLLPMLFLVFFCDFCIFFSHASSWISQLKHEDFGKPFRQSTWWVVIGTPVAALHEDIIKLKKMDLRSHMGGKIW